MSNPIKTSDDASPNQPPMAVAWEIASEHDPVKFSQIPDPQIVSKIK